MAQGFWEERRIGGMDCSDAEDLRRRAVSGQPLRIIHEFFGHADSETTQIYAHYAPSEREVQMVNEAFSIANTDRDNGEATSPDGRSTKTEPRINICISMVLYALLMLHHTKRNVYNCM